MRRSSSRLFSWSGLSWKASCFSLNSFRRATAFSPFPARPICRKIDFLWEKRFYSHRIILRHWHQRSSRFLFILRNRRQRNRVSSRVLRSSVSTVSSERISREVASECRTTTSRHVSALSSERVSSGTSRRASRFSRNIAAASCERILVSRAGSSGSSRDLVHLLTDHRRQCWNRRHRQTLLLNESLSCELRALGDVKRHFHIFACSEAHRQRIVVLFVVNDHFPAWFGSECTGFWDVGFNVFYDLLENRDDSKCKKKFKRTAK